MRTSANRDDSTWFATIVPMATALITFTALCLAAVAAGALRWTRWRAKQRYARLRYRDGTEVDYPLDHLDPPWKP